MKYATEIRLDGGEAIKGNAQDLEDAIHFVRITHTALHMHNGRLAGRKVLGVSLHIKGIHKESEEVQ